MCREFCGANVQSVHNKLRIKMSRLYGNGLSYNDVSPRYQMFKRKITHGMGNIGDKRETNIYPSFKRYLKDNVKGTLKGGNKFSCVSID